MELALGPWIAAYIVVAEFVVSILVFVELALGLWGSHAQATPVAQVSILVFVELALGHEISIPPTIGYIEFQSLFSWNSPSDWTPTSKSGSRIASFNPCFRGTRPRTISGGRHGSRPAEFQSLFSWNSPSDSGLSALNDLEAFRFNPCFRGTRPRTAPDMNAAAAWITVSILVFVELALGLHRI